MRAQREERDVPYMKSAGELADWLAMQERGLEVLSDGEGDLLAEAGLDTYSDDTGDHPCVLLRFGDE